MHRTFNPTARTAQPISITADKISRPCFIVMTAFFEAVQKGWDGKGCSSQLALTNLDVPLPLYLFGGTVNLL